MRYVILLVGALLLPSSVDAADVKLTIFSDPAGATVYEGGDADLKSWGYAPILLKWKLPRQWRSCLTTKPMRVRWASGVEASMASISLCPQAGKQQQITFMRPTGIPGVEIDAQFAVQVQILRAQEAGAAAAASAPLPQSSPKHCTSRIIGNQVFTSCY